MGAFVGYLRVSTDKQGRSGLGLEAQQTAIEGFLKAGDRLVAPIFVETESGKRTDRPELRKALEKCKRTGATLLVAKLDRLARNAHFLLGLQREGVDFVAVDMPHANRLTIGIMAVVAEEEARMISARTKAALAAAKARGVKLGGDRGYRPRTGPGDAVRAAAAVSRQRKAAQFAFNVLPRVEALRGAGASLREVARALDAEGLATPQGATWTAAGVRRVLLSKPAE
ncbi:recombinase family protein [Paracraurococcus ruber]|uniref:Resolvase n=1 Tax=Paracraurococcus ruber TaxID=77675 RepID=A0ABS1CV77_9PROT|nr:recombinase family protein [Paracraurococcus ruber]MBK1658235.1 resolvase [Paracraurococcus ruber]TDG30605.1 recombinase family protein [Paracraurococcus ruber]